MGCSITERLIVHYSTGTDLRVGLVGLGPHILGAPTKSVLFRFYIRKLMLFRNYRGPFVVRLATNFTVHDITGLYCSSVMYFSQQSYRFYNRIQDANIAAITVHWFYFVNFILRNYPTNHKKIMKRRSQFQLFLQCFSVVFFFVFFFKLELIDII